MHNITGTLYFTVDDIDKYGEMYKNLANFNKLATTNAETHTEISIGGIELALLFLAQCNPEELFEKLVGIEFFDPSNIFGLIKTYTKIYKRSNTRYIKYIDEKSYKLISETYNDTGILNCKYIDDEIKFLLIHRTDSAKYVPAQPGINDDMIYFSNWLIQNISNNDWKYGQEQQQQQHLQSTCAYNKPIEYIFNVAHKCIKNYELSDYESQIIHKLDKIVIVTTLDITNYYYIVKNDNIYYLFFCFDYTRLLNMLKGFTYENTIPQCIFCAQKGHEKKLRYFMETCFANGAIHIYNYC